MTQAPVYLDQNLGELTLTVPGFPDLLLTGENTDDQGHTFLLKALDDEATWDNPVPVDVEVQRWMADGAVATTQGHENRHPSFKIAVSAGTAADLAAGEAAVAKRANQRALLTWVPPSGREDAPATVFELWTLHLDNVFDLSREMRLARLYQVQATAKPWARSENITEVDVLNSVSSTASVSIDTCSSVTNWAGSPNTATVSGGQLHESYTATSADVATGTGIFGVTLTRTASVTGLGSTPYLVVDSTVTGGGRDSLYVEVDGVLLDKVAALGTTTWWDLNGIASFATLQISALVVRNRPGTVTLNVNDVSAADTPGGIGTHRQLFRTLDAGGSVPTAGSLCVASPDATALKTVLLYTAPESNGFVPAMRQYRTAGYDETLASDSTTMSGAKERIDASGVSGATFTATIPGDQLREATYAVVARLQASASGLYQQIQCGGSMAGRTNYTDLNTDVNFLAANTWQWCVLGLLALPPSPVPAESTQPLTVSINGNIFLGGTPQVWIDELYLFDITHGDLTIVNTSDPSAVPAATKTRIWVDAPDADPARNRPAIYLGNTDDRSDALAAAPWQITAIGDHELCPDGTLIFTATEGVNDAAVSARYFKRWHTNAGE